MKQIKEQITQKVQKVQNQQKTQTGHILNPLPNLLKTCHIQKQQFKKF